MTVIDERNLTTQFSQVSIGQSCIINGVRYLKIGLEGVNLLNLSDLSTGHAEPSDAISDVTNTEIHLKS